jgi:hypothetical protein
MRGQNEWTRANLGAREAPRANPHLGYDAQSYGGSKIPGAPRRIRSKRKQGLQGASFSERGADRRGYPRPKRNSGLCNAIGRGSALYEFGTRKKRGARKIAATSERSLASACTTQWGAFVALATVVARARRTSGEA